MDALLLNSEQRVPGVALGAYLGDTHCMDAPWDGWRVCCAVDVGTAIQKSQVMRLCRLSLTLSRLGNSFASRWLLHVRVTRITQCGLLFRASKNRRRKSAFAPCCALSDLAMEVWRYCASTLTTYKPAVSIFSASTTTTMSSARGTVCLP